MKKLMFVAMVGVFLLPHVTKAKDVALILNDQEQGQLVRALDAAIRANGLAVAPDILALYNRLKAAPVVESQKMEEKPVKPAAPSKDPPP